MTCGRTGTFALIRQRLAQLAGILAAAAAITFTVCAGSALAQSCPAGTHLYQGSQCCPIDEPPGPDGQCHSLCPAGSELANDPINVEACFMGLAPQHHPAEWNNAAAVCWDGSKPKGPGLNVTSDLWGYWGSCPRPPGAACPFKYDMVQAKGQPIPKQWPWADWICVEAPQIPACQYFQEAGIDRQCHDNLCPRDPSTTHLVFLPVFRANQCCPNGQEPDPAAPGTCHACPPGQVTVTGFCCPPDYKPGSGHWGGCVPVIPRRKLPPPVTVMPPLPGPPPEVTPGYVPRYVPERHRRRPVTRRYQHQRPSTVTPSYRHERRGLRPVTPSHTPSLLR
jgi:hypothetical protein